MDRCSSNLFVLFTVAFIILMHAKEELSLLCLPNKSGGCLRTLVLNYFDMSIRQWPLSSIVQFLLLVKTVILCCPKGK